MINLARHELEVYWEGVSPDAPFIVDSMDAVENWVVDSHTHSDSEIASLFSCLPVNMSQVLRSERREEFINDLLVLLAYLHSSKALRLLDWIGQEVPDFDFLAEAKQLYEGGIMKIDRVAYGLLMNRLRFFKKTALLQMIFAPERLAAVQAAIKQSYKAA